MSLTCKPVKSEQVSEWRYPHEPKQKNPRQSRSKVKVMLLVFFDYHGVVAIVAT